MTKRQLRKRAQDCIQNEKSKHETYEELKLMTSMKPEEVAKIVQGVPTEYIKNKYKIPQVFLLILMGIYVASHAFVVFAFVQKGSNVEMFWTALRLLISLWLFFGFIFYRTEAYRFVKFWMVLGLLRFVILIFSEGFDWLHAVDIFLYLGLIVLSFYLEQKLFPSYRVIKELYQNRLGQDRLRSIIRFED